MRLDILLTLGMIRYVADQQEGRMEPREVDPKLFASARDVEVDWDALRKMAFEASDMKAFLEQQAPPFPAIRRIAEKAGRISSPCRKRRVAVNSRRRNI